MSKKSETATATVSDLDKNKAIRGTFIKARAATVGYRSGITKAHETATAMGIVSTIMDVLITGMTLMPVMVTDKTGNKVVKVDTDGNPVHKSRHEAIGALQKSATVVMVLHKYFPIQKRNDPDGDWPTMGDKVIPYAVFNGDGVAASIRWIVSAMNRVYKGKPWDQVFSIDRTRRISASDPVTGEGDSFQF